MKVMSAERKVGPRLACRALDVLDTARELIERHEGSLRGAQLDSWGSAVVCESAGEWLEARRWRAASTVLAVLDSAVP